jgi:hypothetical protein
MEVTFDRERANWPHNAPGRIYYEHVRNFVGEACFPGEWIVDGPKSLPLDLVFDFPYDLANATPAQVQWARRLLQMQKTGSGYKAADPSNTLTADEWRKAYNLALAANEFSRNENMPIIYACMMNDAVSQLLRIWCADGRVKAFLRNDNGSFSELPIYLWNTDRYKEWFERGGYISAEHAFETVGPQKDKTFPIFFSDVDLTEAAKTLRGGVVDAPGPTADILPTRLDDVAQGTGLSDNPLPPIKSADGGVAKTRTEKVVEEALQGLWGGQIPPLNMEVRDDQIQKYAKDNGRSPPSARSIHRYLGKLRKA